ncbi:MAG: pentapeptide repeat-containing protein [Mycobacterium sp.]|nr:pentapeptide repeat-containing protein [Mycobacterium sp.]
MAEALRAADLRAVDLRGVDFWGVDLRGVDFCGAVAGRAAPASAPADRWLIWCRTNAVPPTATSSGHSTRPTAPMAPRVSAAAADEWLPLLNPERTPLAAPWIPPTTPLTAAPPTAPAAAVVVSASRATPLKADFTGFMCTPRYAASAAARSLSLHCPITARYTQLW